MDWPVLFKYLIILCGSRLKLSNIEQQKWPVIFRASHSRATTENAAMQCTSLVSETNNGPHRYSSFIRWYGWQLQGIRQQLLRRYSSSQKRQWYRYLSCCACWRGIWWILRNPEKTPKVKFQSSEASPITVHLKEVELWKKEKNLWTWYHWLIFHSIVFMIFHPSLAWVLWDPCFSHVRHSMLSWLHWTIQNPSGGLN